MSNPLAELGEEEGTPLESLSQEQIEFTLVQRSVPELGQILLAAFGEIKRRNAGASNRESEADKEVSRIYHEIEFGTFDAAHGYALAKALQTALRGRRAAKTDRGMLKDLTVWIGNSDETLRRVVKRFETPEYQEAADAAD